MLLANKELNETILRPRFTFEIEFYNEKALTAFEATKKTQSNYIVDRIDNHVFIKIPKAQQDFSSPQLHLEIIPINKNRSKVTGLFGPSPTIWTMFMFLHFVIAMCFLGIVVWTYSNWSLERPLNLQLIFAGILTFIWLALYLIGQANKKKRIPEMLEQHHFMRDVLRSLKKKPSLAY